MLKRAKMFSLFSLILVIITSLVYTGQTLVSDTRAASVLAYKGVNLAGAEFGNDFPGTFGSTYTYPTPSEVDYYLGKGMNTFRVPFRWERLQQAQFGSFDAAEQARLTDLVSYATSKGATVVLDPHNYARYYGGLVGSAVPNAAFADFWQRLASLYKANSRVIFSLINEPHDLPTEQWLGSANAGIAAIRSTGATNLILVPGNAYTGAHSWYESWYGTPNAVAMLGVIDPANNYAYDVHQYLDGDSSGQSDYCVSGTIGSERLQAFTGWLHQNGKRGFLGEFGGGRNSTCYAALDNLLTYLDTNSDVWLGWTYWAGGPYWGDYIFTLEPNANGDRPQLASLLPHLKGGPTPPPTTKPGSPPTPPTQPATATPTQPATVTPTQPVPSNGTFGVQYKVDSAWNSGYNASLSIVNQGATPVQGWTLGWTLSKGETLASFWNASCKQSGQTVTCTNLGYNATIGGQGGSTSLGVQFNAPNGPSQPTSFTLNGLTISTGGGQPTPTAKPTTAPATATPTATAKPTTAPATATPTAKPTTAPATPKPTTAPPATATATTSPKPTTNATYGLHYGVDSAWDSGYNVAVTVINNGGTAIKGWTVSWTLAHGETLANFWNASCKLNGQTLTCTNLDYNAELGAKGGSTGFGIQFNTTGGAVTRPTAFKVNGLPVSAS